MSITLIDMKRNMSLCHYVSVRNSIKSPLLDEIKVIGIY